MSRAKKVKNQAKTDNTKKDLDLAVTNSRKIDDSSVASTTEKSITQNPKIRKCNEKLLIANLGKRLKAIRLSRKMTQKKLAKLVNTTAFNISRYELKKTLPSVETLIKIANVFNITIDNLLGRSIDDNDDNSYDETKVLNILEELDKLNKLNNAIVVVRCYNEF